MAKRKIIDTGIRKLTKLGAKSIAVTLPIEYIRALGWKERQKVVVKRVRGGLLIHDWRKR